MMQVGFIKETYYCTDRILQSKSFHSVDGALILASGRAGTASETDDFAVRRVFWLVKARLIKAAETRSGSH
jgi:hypothetical protein